eukprot:COSAG06_NODE_70248_length_193_cov_19.255319_1_plen_42_part_10
MTVAVSARSRPLPVRSAAPACLGRGSGSSAKACGRGHYERRA